MKPIIFIGICLAVALAKAGAQQARNVQAATSNAARDDITSNLNFPSGKSLVFKTGANLTVNGTFGGTPSGGTLNLAALTLTLPATVSGGTSSFQPLDSDLTAIAALSTTSFGRALLALADAAALRTAGGLVIGTDVLAPNGNGSSLTALNASALASGTVADARFPSTLPALNGSALTALNASNIASGTLSADRLASGTGLQVLRRNSGNTALEFATISAGGGDALTSNPLSQFSSTTSAQLAGVLSNETGTGSAVFNSDPLLLAPASAMGALAVDVTKRSNTKTVSADSTLTFSATPTAGATFGLRLTNSDTAAKTITIPSSHSYARGGAITSFTLPASGKVELSWHYDGTTYWLVGDPTTINDLADVTVVAADKLPVHDTSAGTDGKSTVSAVVLAGLPAFSGDATSSAGASALTLATVNSNVGTFGSATAVGSVTVNAKGLVTAASNVTVTPAVGSITGLGTGVATALAVNTGSSGAVVVNGGAGGTPSSITLTNGTGLPQAGTVGLTTTDEPQFSGVNIGHASDTTLSRASAGRLMVEGNTVLTESQSATMTNKTFDAAGTGNVLKLKGYVYLLTPHLADGTGATINTTATAISYGHATFSNSADESANYVEYYFMVPEDIDTSVALRARLKILLGGSDTATHRYVLSSVSVADSAVPTASTLANAINIDFSGDGSGASGDVETSAWTTLTSWAGALTAGQTWRIRLARDGNATEDASTVNSTELGLVIEYGKTQ